jgi:hypothetical protein
MQLKRNKVAWPIKKLKKKKKTKPPLFYFVLKSLLKNINFFVMCLIVGVIFLVYIWFCFYLLYRQTMFFENKKYLFLNDILNMCSLTCYSFFLFILFNRVKLYKKSYVHQISLHYEMEQC